MNRFIVQSSAAVFDTETGRSCSRARHQPFLDWLAAGNAPSPDPNDTPANRAAAVKSAVNAHVAALLAPSDFRFGGDYPLSATFTQANKDALAARRQAARDFGNALDLAATRVEDIAAMPWPVV